MLDVNELNLESIRCSDGTRDLLTKVVLLHQDQRTVLHTVNSLMHMFADESNSLEESDFGEVGNKTQKRGESEKEDIKPLEPGSM